MNTYISPFEYLGIMVQGGNIFYFLINALFLFLVMPKLQPKRNEATAAIHKSLAWLLVIYLVNYSMWVVPELLQPTCGYYQIARVYPSYDIFMEYMDLAILPLSMVFGSTVLVGRMPKRWLGGAIIVPYLFYAINDVLGLLPFRLYTFAYITTILTVMAQLAWYGHFIKRFDKKLMETYSNIDRRSTRWVFWTLVPLFFLSILYIPLNILTDDAEYMVLYDFLTFVFLSSIVGCALSYKVDDMTVDLIKEQLLEMKPEENKYINEFKEDFAQPASVEPTATATPDPAPASAEPTTSESPAAATQETENAPSANTSKFVNFAETLDKLEADRFYLDTEVNIDWISSKLGTNRHYVSEYLNQVKHVTFYEYVNTLRLNHAEQLLKEGKETVADVAFISGFNSDHTFRRLFKERYGCTPLQYQKSA